LKKLAVFLCVFILQPFLYSQDNIDTVKYFWYMNVPAGESFTYVTLSKGSFVEGESMKLDPQTLPTFASRWQPVYDALVGSELGLEVGAIDSTVLISVTLDSLDSEESHYLPIIGNVVFLYLEIDVVYKGVWYTPENHFYFKNGKAAIMNIPISDNFLGFCNNIGINVNDGVSFAFVVRDSVTNEDKLDVSGLSWIKNDSVINIRLQHFSRFGGGGKTMSSVEEKFFDDIKDFNLDQNYPNPFNPSTKIKYSVPKDGFITLKVYNIIGSEVATIISGYRKAGTYIATFDAEKLSSGVYFYTLRFNNSTQSRKMVLVR
jgi:hypothetical protein